MTSASPITARSIAAPAGATRSAIRRTSKPTSVSRLHATGATVTSRTANATRNISGPVHRYAATRPSPVTRPVATGQATSYQR